MSASHQQWLRKSSLVISGTNESLDLSEMHFRFRTTEMNEEAPNTLSVRVYNLSQDTVKKITNQTPVEYTLVELKAGYQDNDSYGTIFTGTIKQYRKGRESATDTYLDILAAEDDIAYNFGVVSDQVIAGTPISEIVSRTAKGMGLEVGYIPPISGGTLPRGKVLWGMGRVIARNLANTQGFGWTIKAGKLQMVPLNSYLPGEIVVLNSATGMIGIPEQTNEGVRVRCLLNPRLYIGGQMQIDNESINKTVQGGSKSLVVGQLPYDQWAGVSMPADVTADGFYMMYVIEHSGDTRGTDWYSDVIGLAMSERNGTVNPYGS